MKFPERTITRRGDCPCGAAADCDLAFLQIDSTASGGSVARRMACAVCVSDYVEFSGLALLGPDGGDRGALCKVYIAVHEPDDSVAMARVRFRASPAPPNPETEVPTT